MRRVAVTSFVEWKRLVNVEKYVDESENIEMIISLRSAKPAAPLVRQHISIQKNPDLSPLSK
jgi:hypothetical protein